MFWCVLYIYSCWMVCISFVWVLLVREWMGGCCDFCLICYIWSFKCVCRIRLLISSCRCLKLVSSVNPDAMRSAVFCIVYNACCGCNRWQSNESILYSIDLVMACMLRAMSHVFFPLGRREYFGYWDCFRCFGFSVINVYFEMWAVVPQHKKPRLNNSFS